jgi:predicted nucleotidyltransferase
MLTDNDIRRIVERIVTGYGPLVVGTFGSYAIGSPKPKSDLDLFVIKSRVERGSSRRGAIGRLLFGTLHPLDVHVFTPQEFEETVYQELSFTWIIARQACVYHWDPSAERLVPSLVNRCESCMYLAQNRKLE